MKLDEGQRRAAELIELLSPACFKIEVAGSIRRGLSHVRDIELVAEPHFVEALAVYEPPPAETQGRLFDLDTDTAAAVSLPTESQSGQPHTAKPHSGKPHTGQPTTTKPRHKKPTAAKVSALNGRVASLVHSNSAELTYALRPDGQKPLRNGDRYKRLVFHDRPVDLFIVQTPAQWGPIMALRTGPADFSRCLVTHRSQGGAMPDHLRQENGRIIDKHGRVLQTPSEADYFRALGVSCWKPSLRNWERLQALLRQQARS